MNGIIIGGVCILIGAIFYFKKKKWISTSIRTTGIIVKIITKRVHKADGRISWTNIPLVKFNFGGKEYSFENEVGGTQYDKENIEVEVLFNPENPSDARIVSFLSLWFLESVLTIIGLLFIITGVILESIKD